MTAIAPFGARCDCGAPAVSLCGTGGDYPTVVHCLKPVCRADGHWCGIHRHQAGSMTYALANAELRAEFRGFVADDNLWDRIRTFFWNRASLKWKLKKLLEQHARAHPPPAPLPKLVIFYVGKRFVQDGDVMQESTEKINA